jgi:transcriptional regulator with XRE-family HTH domain
MPYGLPWSEEFVAQLSDKEIRDEFVADQIRTRIASLIRALREQQERKWTQAELGKRAGKPQNVISRYEDPDYGKMSLQTLLEVAAAFDLPVWVDIPEWEDWFARIKDMPSSKTHRTSFDLERLVAKARVARQGASTGSIGNIVPLTKVQRTETAAKISLKEEYKKPAFKPTITAASA